MNVREAAVKVLYEIDFNSAYSNAELSKILKSTSFDSRDRGLLFEIVYGTLKNRIKLDFIISKYSKLRLKKISPWVLEILRTGIYQLMFLERVPDSAACNECAKLAAKFSNRGAVGFVNGMLRNVSREKEKIAFPEKEKDVIKYFSVKYSFPEWMVEKLIKQYGEDEAESFMAESNESHGIYIRVNTLKTDITSLVKKLQDNNIEAEIASGTDNMLYLSKNIDITTLDEYREGLFSLQNISSKMAVDILAPEENDVVIDMCAAPGGKSMAIAERMSDKGCIYSFDIHSHKIDLIENSAKRLGISIIKAEVSDALVLNNDFIEKADKVLVDAPCSGLGTIHKKPDIKWTRSEEDTGELSKIQKKILDNASKYVKDGGELLYSTCTILSEENEENVERFLNKNKNFEKLYEKQILTGKDGETGFYICKLKKINIGG